MVPREGMRTNPCPNIFRRSPLQWRAALTLLLGGGDELAGGGSGALLRSLFLFYVLGILGNLVIDGLDFPGKVKILRVLCVGLE